VGTIIANTTQHNCTHITLNANAKQHMPRLMKQVNTAELQFALWKTVCCIDLHAWVISTKTWCNKTTVGLQ